MSIYMVYISGEIILYFTIKVNTGLPLAIQNPLRYYLADMAQPVMLSPKSQIKNLKLLVLAHIAKSLMHNLDNPALKRIMLETVVNALWSVEAGAYFEWNPTEKELALAARYRGETGRGEEYLPKVTIEADQWIPGELLATKMVRAYAAADDIPETYKQISPEFHEHLQQIFGAEENWFPLLGIPVYTDKYNIGVLVIHIQASSIEFYEQEVQFLQMLADLLATALQTARSKHPSEPAAQIDQVDQMRAEALAILSHEMRTPLASIKGYATALLLDEVNWPAEKRNEFLQLIDKETDNLKTMINEVLDSSLIDIGQFMLEFQPVRLNLIARQVAEEMQQHSDVHQIVIDFPEDFPIVDADQRRITQVIRNIVDNAIKYSPEGGLILMRGEKRQKDVVVSISDTGVGISPEDLIPLFDKYFRVKSPTGYYVPGTGLGLPVARALIEEHQGRIWAESQVGEGTVLFFSLPFSQFDQD